MTKPIPKKGSKILSLDDVHYRWIAYATQKGTEVRIAYEEVDGGQKLIAQVPKVFDLRWLEDIINYGLKNGWGPLEAGDDFLISRFKATYRIILEK